MAVTVNIHEAKTNFSKLLARAIRGEEVIIAKAGTPVARLVPFKEQLVRRVPGTAVGKLLISPEFDAALPDDVLEAFEG
ncbi:MAG TPA: type II toxin-antitoxin system Phd/YefM family antitoxin [Roseiflexaceae bacterium]|nr:type II toxin-antitoxin system Phd/YefM family antitoxin [Roseiflexaceae bacterium]